jgi:integrase/recombinase XerD
MKPANLAPLLEGFFATRLVAQSNASPHTIASYRDTFRMLLRFTQAKTNRAPSSLNLADLTPSLISAFLDDIEKRRTCCARTRNLRLTAIRSFFHYAVLEAPEHADLIQRVLAIPPKRHCRKVVGFLSRPEIEAILSVINRSSWIGQRDYALLLTMMQTGLRLAEITSLEERNVHLGIGAHIRCEGKGRKERCVPLTKSAASVLRSWIVRRRNKTSRLFPALHGDRLSHDAVQDLVAKYADAAVAVCPSLAGRHVTPHMLRHTAARETAAIRHRSVFDRYLAGTRICGDNAGVPGRELGPEGKALGAHAPNRRNPVPLPTR